MGNGVVAGTLTPGGRWLSLGRTHAAHGRIVLTEAPPFAGDGRDQSAVRAYRAALAAPARRGFGLELLASDAEPYLVEDSLPLAVHDTARARVEALTFAPAERAGAVQIVRVAARERPFSAEVRWTGAMRLARAAYAQLTPGGALPPAPSRPVAGEDGRLLWIDDRALGAAAAIALPADTEVPARSSVPLVVALALADTLDEAAREAALLAAEALQLVEEEVGRRRRWWEALGLTAGGRRRAPGARSDRPPTTPHASADRAIRRGVAYALDCASARAGASVAVLADHEILPLVWTRDAYYACRTLLALAPHDERVSATVEGFLRWMFETAERPRGWWPRASLASGASKDPIFQLDQQLYPFLLLEDHARLTGTRSLVERYAGARAMTLAALLARRTDFGLIATDETPADDPLEQPFHFSSHVLLWRVLRDVDPAAADEVRGATRTSFLADGRFAYAVRGPRGEAARHYHDANDLPTVFAPGWGFCTADDPAWRATIEFAWSEGNAAYFGGPLGGLGSLHTPHPWPLGDLQEIVVARVLADHERERRAWARLERVETWDGLLPEAYDESSGSVASRHWFAWPAALRALLALDPMLTAP